MKVNGTSMVGNDAPDKDASDNDALDNDASDMDGSSMQRTNVSYELRRRAGTRSRRETALQFMQNQPTLG
jgi:hypothetical protein